MIRKQWYGYDFSWGGLGVGSFNMWAGVALLVGKEYAARKGVLMAFCGCVCIFPFFRGGGYFICLG